MNQGINWSCLLKIKTPLFLLGGEGKTGFLRGYCKDKVPKSYIGFWALSEDVEWSEEGQIVIRGSNSKSHE